jgi:hypothetical protein
METSPVHGTIASLAAPTASSKGIGTSLAMRWLQVAAPPRFFAARSVFAAIRLRMENVRGEASCVIVMAMV